MEVRTKALLAMSPEEGEAIRDAARARSLGSGYSYKERAARVLAALENTLHAVA
jgi:hypothetical protein